MAAISPETQEVLDRNQAVITENLRAVIHEIVENPRGLEAKGDALLDAIFDNPKAQADLKTYMKKLPKDTALTKIAAKIPVWIEEYHFKTVADTERIYRYDHGVYLDDGETILKALIEEEFGDITTDTIVRDVIGKVKRRTYIDRAAFNNRELLNVKNGLIDLDLLELEPHDPDYFSTSQLNVVYDPDTTAPKIQKFLSEVAQPGDIELIKELIGWLLWPEYHIHKAVMLLGPGRNGKGTLLRLITAFLGERNVSHVTLQKLVSDRFSMADLFGKVANIGGDLPSKDLSDTAAFRNLTGGDDMRAEEKYRPAFDFRNKAKMLFSANVLPKSPDDTFAFYSRWILLEFLNTFTEENGKADPDLDAKLQTSEELSGLLNIALEGLERLREHGWKFSYDKCIDDVEIMYKRNSNPVLAFLLDECEEAAESYIEKSVFFNLFKDYAKKHGLKPMSTTRFGELLKDQSEIPVSDYRPHWGDGSIAAPRCWLGVRFKQSKTSIPSIVPVIPSLDRNGVYSYSKVGISPSVDGMDGSIQGALSRVKEEERMREEHFRTPSREADT